MGFYWISAIYIGRLLSQDAYERLSTNVNPNDIKDWIKNTNDPRGRYILHAPNSYIQIGFIDPILEQSEIQQGFVNKNELHKILTPLQIESLQPNQNEQEKLKYFIKCAAKDEQDDSFQTYIIQTQYSTYDSSNKVSHNIRVK